MPPAATTSLSDCLGFPALCTGIAGLHYFLGLAGFLAAFEEGYFTKCYARRHGGQVVEPAAAARAYRLLYQRPSTFFVVWLPWLGWSAGTAGISLLRDAGFLIFPWPMVFNGVLFGVLLSLSGVLRYRRFASLLVQRPDEPA